MRRTIHAENGHFLDAHGRILNLRGVNLSGSSKLPSNKLDDIKNNALDEDPKVITFVDRPFPLSQASLHFSRLRACGFQLIRFIVTWEAIEHAGPGIYDAEYLKYVRQILQMAHEFGLQIYIDPHQDVWSRWTGGDGAPLWTLELAGFRVDNFRRCEAAVCRENYGTGHSTDETNNNSTLPKMIWPTNYFKLACATMFTLFWAGERFAPHCLVVNDAEEEEEEEEKDTHTTKVNIQTFLQTHYINAMAELLKHLQGLENIVGIGTMNEPSCGYINVDDLSRGFAPSPTPSPDKPSSSSSGINELRYGLAPTPFQGMALGEGYPQAVAEWSNGIMQHVLGRCDRTVVVQPDGKKVWKSNTKDAGCIWKREGVWRINPQTQQPELVKPKYFANVDFGTECYLPFATKYANTLQQVWGTSDTPLHIFVELPPLEFHSSSFPEISSSEIPHAINATHWYDGVTLFTRSWKSYFSFDIRTHRPVWGYNNIFKMHSNQLKHIRQLGMTKMNSAPTLIGETGIPFDMTGNNNTKWDSFDSQTDAMDHTLRCLEKNLLSFTLWCYTPDNTNARGDSWNGEDLSVFCNDQKKGLDESDPLYIYDGMRAAPAVIRPYARCIAGIPLENTFDSKKGFFLYRGVANGDNTQYDVPTEIFVPKYWCLTPSEMQIRVFGGKFEVEEQSHWFIVKYWHEDSSKEQRVEIQFSRKTKSRRRIWGVPFN
ncbi:hypothetical protein ACHAW6_014248 [Cyclotella cf. meneghiniana]